MNIFASLKLKELKNSTNGQKEQRSKSASDHGMH